MKIGLYHQGPAGPMEIKIGEMMWDMCPRAGEKIVYDNTLWYVRHIAHVTDDHEVVIMVEAVDGLEVWQRRGQSE